MVVLSEPYSINGSINNIVVKHVEDDVAEKMVLGELAYRCKCGDLHILGDSMTERIATYIAIRQMGMIDE